MNRINRNKIPTAFILGLAFYLPVYGIDETKAPPATLAQLAQADQKQDAARTAILQQQKTELLAIDERRTKIGTDLDNELKKLQTAREELRATHGKRQIESAAKMAALDEKFQAQLVLLRNKRSQVSTANAAKIVELDKELAVIQEQARVRYTDEVSKSLKAHDEKRKGQEAARAASEATVEDERVAALNAYFEALAAHEVATQAETQTLDQAKSDQLSEHATKTATLTDLYNEQLANLAAERAKIAQTSSDKLYSLLQVTDRTTPVVVGPLQGSKGHSLSDLAEGRKIDMVFTYAGVTLPTTDPMTTTLSKSISNVVAGIYVEGFSFSEDGEILFLAKPLTIALHYTVGGIKLSLPTAAELKMQQTILAALIQNLYRVPEESFTGLKYEPVDTAGKKVTYRDNPRLTAVIRALVTRNSGDLTGVTQVDDQTFAIDGKAFRVNWYFTDANNAVQPVSLKPKTEQDEIQARWVRVMKRSFTPISVPAKVRAKLATAASVSGPATIKLATLLKAPDRCKGLIFVQNGTGEILVARAQDKAMLFTAIGVDSLGGVACAADSIAVVAKAIRRTELLKFDINQTPGIDIPAADLVVTDSQVESRGNIATLFVIHQNILKIAVVSTEGTFKKVQALGTEKGSFRAWSADEKGVWNTQFTFAIPYDASVVNPDVGSVPPAESELTVAEGK